MEIFAASEAEHSEFNSTSWLNNATTASIHDHPLNVCVNSPVFSISSTHSKSENFDQQLNAICSGPANTANCNHVLKRNPENDLENKLDFGICQTPSIPPLPSCVPASQNNVNVTSAKRFGVVREDNPNLSHFDADIQDNVDEVDNNEHDACLVWKSAQSLNINGIHNTIVTSSPENKIDGNEEKDNARKNYLSNSTKHLKNLKDCNGNDICSEKETVIFSNEVRDDKEIKPRKEQTGDETDSDKCHTQGVIDTLGGNNVRNELSFKDAERPVVNCTENMWTARRKTRKHRLDKGNLMSCCSVVTKERIPVRKSKRNNVSYDGRGSERDEVDRFEEDQSCRGCYDTFHKVELNEHELACTCSGKLGNKFKNSVYRCPVCKLDCTSKIQLKRHLMEKHSNLQSFTCLFCRVELGPMQTFLQHLQVHLKSIKELRNNNGHKKVKNDICANNKLSSQNMAASKEITSSSLPEESKFCNIDCNTSVNNDHTFLLQLLEHKINETLNQIPEDPHFSIKTSHLTNTTLIPNTNGISLSTESELKPVKIAERGLESGLPNLFLLGKFSHLSKELNAAINKSFGFFEILIKRFLSELDWNNGNGNGPTDAKDLIFKLNTLARMSSGITNVADCLAQVLGKEDQNSGDTYDESVRDCVKRCTEKIENEDGDRNIDYNDSDVNDDGDDVGNDSGDYDDKGGVNNSVGNDDVSCFPAGSVKNDPNICTAKRDLNTLELASRKLKNRRMKKNYICNPRGTEFTVTNVFDMHTRASDTAKFHQCEVCAQQFRQKRQLKSHYTSVHSIAGKFKCNLCSYGVKTLGVFLNHMSNKHNSDKRVVKSSDYIQHFICDDKNDDDDEKKGAYEIDESMKFKTLGVMENKIEIESNLSQDKDMENETGNMKESEEKAGVKLTLKLSNLKKRLKSKEKKKTSKVNKLPSVCNECGVELARYSRFMGHEVVHQDMKPHQCLTCSKTFRREFQLQRHKMVHAEKTKNYKCDFCDLTAETRVRLKKHMLNHDSDGLLSCDGCEYKTHSSHQLVLHKKRHKSKDCKYCEHRAENLSDLRVHERNNHRMLSCSQCNYACHTDRQLQRHLKTHNRDDASKETYFCEICGFSCHTRRQFTYHVQRHANKTPFSCSECDYKCSSSSSLTAHKLKHAGVKPFLCSFCGVSFRRSSHLNNHLLIHRDEKPFVCQTCRHPFRTRHNLKVHETIHTGEKQHKCQLCPFACRRSKELRLHLEKHKLQNIELVQSHSFIVPKVETFGNRADQGDRNSC